MDCFWHKNQCPERWVKFVLRVDLLGVNYSGFLLNRLDATLVGVAE
jgi:hypothetical protein